ncbi:MAG: hypothetical protein LBQ48_06795 [Oscillospiraceae bacterium]|jgi:hypothetical protein|nr:hypothetical protein [Oscillospiraceae bacterium]
MKRKICGESVPPACEYCVHGRLGASRENIYCLKRGITELHDSCKKFVYDPMRRKPRALPRQKKHTPADFEI